ncbi:hypothetical protein [Burkholderia sp. TSV86]|uniref:hypothetical protein n=1 Tax=Burkholderia sp. TSV86 TaxID=1385594 RepID=UPI00075BFFF2|nr:hypothetical protein [Burkholderia sp. TSV86]KVE39425.1 hypothetical protein WS68_21975 [Burkholderia sp. TSV86]
MISMLRCVVRRRSDGGAICVSAGQPAARHLFASIVEVRANAPVPRTEWKVRLRADRVSDAVCRRARARPTSATVDIAIA